MTEGRLTLNVTREDEEIVEDLIEYRNQKIESDAEFPASYKAVVYGTGNPSEDAFYNVHTNSHIRMEVEPMTGFEQFEDMAKAIQETENTETEIRAKVDGIYEHGPVLQTGLEALETAGFNPYVEIEARNSDSSITEALKGLKDKGATVDIWANESEVNEHPDSHYIKAEYDVEQNILSPDCQVCAPAHVEEGEVEELERRMEEALDEVGLLD